MDAVKFLRAEKRLCTGRGCDHCIFYENGLGGCTKVKDGSPQAYVALIERWSDEHPEVTNLQKFKEVFGKSPMPYEGDINGMHVSWWAQEYKEPGT